MNKDIPDGKIVTGIPAKVIGDLKNLAAGRRKYSESPLEKIKRDERLKFLWDRKETKRF